MTNLRRYWPLLVIVAILAAIVCVSQYADSAKNRAEERAANTKAAAVAEGKNCEATHDAQQPYKPPVWAKYVAWPESVGAWAVILTLLTIAWQSIETRRSAEAAEKAYRLAENTAKRQLRAYLSVSSARLFLYPDGSVEPRVVIANSGQTPAYGLRGVQAMGIDQRPLRVLKPVEKRANYGDVGKEYHLTGQRQQLPSVTEKVSSTHQEIARLILDGFPYLIVVHGWFTYEDIFGDMHPLNFRLVSGDDGVLYKDHDDVSEWYTLCDDRERTEADKRND